LPIGVRNWLRTRAYAPVKRVSALTPPTAEVGSEIARPAARQPISIIQPRPAYSGPPMIQSSGMNTSLPEFGPFWNTALSGRWRRPMFTPGVCVGTRAHVMPRSASAPRR
jgi:hypothetical protein